MKTKLIFFIYTTMLKTIKSVYLIGIGGISMSALAVMLKNRGLIVKGSDLHISPLTSKLVSMGIEINEGDAPQFVKDCDAVIYTGAVSNENRDICLAKRFKKKIFSRADILGMFSRERKTISIAGTHGKTTTTGLISSILLESNFDPTIHIGGELNSIGSNFHIGNGDLLVTEACEYKDAFLSLKNYISIVLNIEEDHLDYFKNYNNILNSFNKFIENTSENGVVVYNYDTCKDKLSEDILKVRQNISFGISDKADLQAVNINEHKAGMFAFDALYQGKNLGQFKLTCFGKHNVYNALASIATALILGIDAETIKKGIETFKGIARRMDIIKEEKPLIIHDYAHHPQEIEASLNAIKSIKQNKLICIFQPHTFSRTQALYQEFCSCFDLCDEVWLLPIYPAREKAIKGITSYQLFKDLKKKGLKSRYFSNFDACKSKVSSLYGENITFAILGAGDIEGLSKMLKNDF